MPALADEAPAYGARARTRVPIVSTHGHDASASGSTLDLTKRLSLPNNLTDVVREAPGANVLSQGGIGAFASVSLRGADGEETAVLVDEIPLTTPEGGAFDLSTLPPNLFSSVEVFRGGAPVWLGSGAVGGVLRLVTRRDPETLAAAGVTGGSWGTLGAEGRTAVVRGSGSAFRSNVFVRHTEGDYRYTDDGNTPADPRDDRARRVQNGQLDEASGFLDGELRLGPGALRLFALVNESAGGFPGPASRPTPRIRRSQSRAILASTYTILRGPRAAPRQRIQLLWSGAYGANRYADVFGQLGTSKQTLTDDRNLRTFFRAAYDQRLTRFLAGTLLATYAYDRYAPDNVFQFPAVVPSDRHGVAGAAELTLRGTSGPLSAEIRPSARLEYTRTTLHARTSLNGPFEGGGALLVPTARIGGVIGAYGLAALSGSIATGMRLPSIYELFGDRGQVLPSPELKPVHSTSYDVGLTLEGEVSRCRGALETRAFWQERRDAIALTRAGQYQSLYQNYPSLDQRGVEVGFVGQVRELARTSASFTWLDTNSHVGRTNDEPTRLPFRPRYIASLTPQVLVPVSAGPLSSASTSLELSYRSFVFADRANLAVVPDCTKLNLGGSLGFLRDRLRVSARVEDVADARCFNLIGYPLPGRSVFITIRYEEKSDASFDSKL